MDENVAQSPPRVETGSLPHFTSIQEVEDEYPGFQKTEVDIFGSFTPTKAEQVPLQGQSAQIIGFELNGSLAGTTVFASFGCQSAHDSHKIHVLTMQNFRNSGEIARELELVQA